MIVSTRYDGVAYTKGDILNVDEEVAERWVSRRIAIMPKKKESGNKDDTE